MSEPKLADDSVLGSDSVLRTARTDKGNNLSLPEKDLNKNPKTPENEPKPDGNTEKTVSTSADLILTPESSTESDEGRNGLKNPQTDSRKDAFPSKNCRNSVSEKLPGSVSTTVSSSSPPNFLQVTASATLSPVAAIKTATVSSRSSEGHVTVKTEPQDDIKDYVETTMNELLGWYGLPKMDKSDTPQLTLGTYPSPLPVPASASTPTSTAPSASSQRCPSRPTSVSTTTATPTTNATATTNSTMNRTNIRRGHKADKRNKRGRNSPDAKLANNDTNNNSSSCGGDDEDDDEDDLDDDDDDDDDDIDDDFGDDMDDLGDSVSAGSDLSAGGFVSPGLIGGGVPDSERGVAIICSWCQKQGTKLFTLGTPSGVKSFCSEICFTQCRRASFKKNKVCDWCKHVRHTVNFVDFLDGDIQLQFCSEKCLNQYKMNIFCTEARQHLEQIQNMTGEDGKKGIGDGRNERREGEILITPELWLSGNSDEKITIKEEVNDEVDDRKAGGEREDIRSNGRIDDEEEPGEVREREREKARRAAALEMGVRAALSDDSSCSNEERIGLKLTSPLPSVSRQRNDSFTSSLLISKTEDGKNHSDLRYRRDRERIRQLLIDGKCGTGGSSHGKESGCISSSKDKSDKHSHSSPQKHTNFTPARHGASGTSDQSNTTGLLPNWATSQLLAMMPPHVSSSLAAANINSSLGNLGYASSPLLYSSLFGPNPLVMGAQKENAAASLAKSRHESRRELLRDRDRSHETERGERKRESSERSAPAVPVSPSTSHSSSDTPGPSSTPGMNPGIVPGPGLNPAGFIPEFARHLPHPLLSGDINQSIPLPHYFTDPALAGMFQLPPGLNLSQTHRGLGPPAVPSASALPPPGSLHHGPPPPPLPPTTGSQPQVPPSTSQPQPPLSQPPGMPPVTVLVPYPVAIPIPIPVPIPLPITPEKLFAFFREKAEQAKASASNTSRWSTENHTDHTGRSSVEGRSRASSVSRIVNPSPIVSPRPSSKSSSVGCPPYGSTSSLVDASEAALTLPSGRESADSIMTLRREIGRSQLKAASTSPCSFSSMKRTLTPNLTHTLDLTKRARMDSTQQHSEDEAMDLSKMSSRSDSPRKSGHCSEKENCSNSLAKRLSHSDSDIDTSSHPQNLKVPRIHIISERPEPPLCQPPVSMPTLPPPPEQSTYSSRRSRILDAPSVPKRSRSPSPERRYVRTVPRDMVEAARRRGLRARVRSK